MSIPRKALQVFGTKIAKAGIWMAARIRSVCRRNNQAENITSSAFYWPEDDDLGDWREEDNLGYNSHEPLHARQNREEMNELIKEIKKDEENREVNVVEMLTMQLIELTLNLEDHIEEERARNNAKVDGF